MWFLELNASWIITLYRVCYFSLLFCIWRVLLKIVHTQPHEGQYSRSPMQNKFNGIHTKCHIFVSLSPPLDLCPAIAGSNQGSSTDDSCNCLKKLVCRICICIRKGNIQLMHLRINKVMFLYFNCLLWYYQFANDLSSCCNCFFMMGFSFLFLYNCVVVSLCNWEQYHEHALLMYISKQHSWFL